MSQDRPRRTSFNIRVPVAQGIEHQLAELRVVRSNRAGHTTKHLRLDLGFFVILTAYEKNHHDCD